MIVWGSFASVVSARYNPASDTWAMVSTTDAPSGAYNRSAVWTGSEMIVWGGDNNGELNSGGRYNPASDTWTPMGTTGAPAGRSYHSAAWTGSEMIVWGGYVGNFTPGFVGFLNDGGRYNPASDTWTAVTTTGALAVRAYHTAVWTGSEMIVFGGANFSRYLNDTWALSYQPSAVQVNLFFGPLVPGNTYTVQRSTDLSPASWLPLTGATQTDVGSERTVIDPQVLGSKAFYRVLITAP
jgi:N-acetylneuraminic acid mutarotase